MYPHSKTIHSHMLHTTNNGPAFFQSCSYQWPVSTVHSDPDRSGTDTDTTTSLLTHRSPHRVNPACATQLPPLIATAQIATAIYPPSPWQVTDNFVLAFQSTTPSNQESWQVPAAMHLGWCASGYISSLFTVTTYSNSIFSSLSGPLPTKGGMQQHLWVCMVLPGVLPSPSHIWCHIFPTKFWHQIGKYNFFPQTWRSIVHNDIMEAWLDTWIIFCFAILDKFIS